MLAQPDQHFYALILTKLLQYIINRKLSYQPGAPHVKSSTAQKRLRQTVQPLPWDDSYQSHIIPRVAMGMPLLRTHIQGDRPRTASSLAMTTTMDNA